MGDLFDNFNTWANWNKHLSLVREKEEKIRVKKVIFLYNKLHFQTGISIRLP